MTTGTPNAEFGDKTSLVVQATTRVPVWARARVFGNVDATYGTFGRPAGMSAWVSAQRSSANFIAADGVRSGRFLDTPAVRADSRRRQQRDDFRPPRLSAQRQGRFHLNLFTARNWTQIPNSLDQLSPGSEIARAHLEHRARVSAHPQRAHADHDQSLYSERSVQLLREPRIRHRRYARHAIPAAPTSNWGVKADVATTIGHNNIKYGIDLKQTRLLENFQFGVTDPSFNSPCIFNDGSGVGDRGSDQSHQCAALGFEPESVASNTDVTARLSRLSLLPYDLSRGGRLFDFHDTGNINQDAIYIQDGITLGNLEINVGPALGSLQRADHETQPEPRLGLATTSNVPERCCVLSYARTMETPFNENLLLSSATGAGGLAQTVFGSNSRPDPAGFPQPIQYRLPAGRRQIPSDRRRLFLEVHAQRVRLQHTAEHDITFPIAWHNSKLDGVTGRVSTTNMKGFQAYWTFGHTRARFFFPEDGGLDPPGNAAQRQCFPYRSRSGVRIEREPALPASEKRGVDFADLSLRQRPGSQRRSRCRRRARAHAESGGDHRPRLQWSFRHAGPAAH